MRRTVIDKEREVLPYSPKDIERIRAGVSLLVQPERSLLRWLATVDLLREMHDDLAARWPNDELAELSALRGDRLVMAPSKDGFTESDPDEAIAANWNEIRGISEAVRGYTAEEVLAELPEEARIAAEDESRMIDLRIEEELRFWAYVQPFARGGYETAILAANGLPALCEAVARALAAERECGTCVTTERT